MPSLSYKMRVKVLFDNKIGLWDVVKSCRRQGSIDAKIKQAELNDIRRLLSGYREITAIFCNGQKAHYLLTRHFKDINMPVIVLPSTSPAYTKPLNWKLKKWRIIKKYMT